MFGFMWFELLVIIVVAFFNLCCLKMGVKTGFLFISEVFTLQIFSLLVLILSLIHH